MTEENQGLVFIPRDELFFKIAIISDPQVEKTRFLNQFVSRRFDERYLPTIGLNISKEQVILNDEMGNNLVINLQIWDIAPQPQFYMLHRPYFNGSDGAILMYDVSELSNLDIVPEKIQEIRKFCGDIPIFMLGIIQPYRTIPIEKIAKINEKYKLSGFYETTPESRRIVENIFKQMVKIIYERYVNSTR